jgi:hypothetical protein
MDEREFKNIRRRYRFAFDVYRDLVALNAAVSGTSDRPSIEQLQQEQQALDDLTAARRELLDALRTIPPAVH